MPLNLVTGPAAEPVHLDEAKKHLRVDHANDDALISATIRAARDMVEGFTRRALVLQTFEQVLDVFPARIETLRSPLRKLISITYLDTDGASQTLATTGYTADAKSEPARIVEAYGKSWPSTRDDLNAVTIKFQAGHAVPFTANATTDTLTAKGHPYSNNDIVRLLNSGGALPAGLADKTDYYVVNVSGDTLQLSATLGGAALDITGAGTGTHFLGELPESLRHALLLILAELYERRESAIVGAQIMPVPYSAEMLMWPYRVHGHAFG